MERVTRIVEEIQRLERMIEESRENDLKTDFGSPQDPRVVAARLCENSDNRIKWYHRTTELRKMLEEPLMEDPNDMDCTLESTTEEQTYHETNRQASLDHVVTLLDEMFFVQK